MQQTDPLQPGYFYHIYNCGINGENLYTEEANNNHFLKLYDKHIEPVAETYAWCLMVNHFHLLVRVKENITYKYSNADRPIDAVRFEEVKWETIKLPQSTVNLSSSKGHDSVKQPDATKHFAHLFDAYAKYFNLRNSRHGSLFERPFKRKRIDSENYLKQLVVYIHNNPVHHKFCNHPYEYPWSSYHTCLSKGKTKLKRDDVLEWFGDIENFKYLHNEKADITVLEN